MDNVSEETAISCLMLCFFKICFQVMDIKKYFNVINGCCETAAKKWPYVWCKKTRKSGLILLDKKKQQNTENRVINL